MEARHRVVVYSLDEASKWSEIGMGYCEYEMDESDNAKVIVHSESDGNVFFTVNIHHDIVYRQEQDTIIAWSDPDGSDYALSFEDSLGCERYWGIIHNIQTSVLSSNESDPSSSTFEHTESPQRNAIELPPVDLNSLSEIEDVITQSSYSWFSRTQLVKHILNENYMDKLFDVFEIAEDLESTDDLYKIFHIFKKLGKPQTGRSKWLWRKFCLVLLHNADLMEMLMRDEYIVKFVSVFEYDPGCPANKANYREFLKDKAVFKEIIPIKNEEIKGRIHVAFRAQYLKDIVLSKVLNDEAFLLLNNIIRTSYQIILDKIECDHEFLASLTSLMMENKDESLRKALLGFMKELTGIMKALSRDSSLLKVFKFEHLLDFLDSMFMSEDEVEIILMIADLFLNILSSLIVEMREYVLLSYKKNPQGIKILPHIIEKFNTTSDDGIRSLCSQILRLLLNSNPTDIKNDDFMNMIYSPEGPIQPLLSPLQDLVEAEGGGKVALSHAKADLYYHLCGLLSVFVTQHTYRIKYVIIGGSVIQNAMKLTQCQEKYLVLGAIRLFRTIVGMLDEFYNRFIIKNQLFVFLIPLLDQYIRVDSLVCSALLELFEFIRQKNVKNLIDHLVTHHGEAMSACAADNEVFAKLKLRHEQNHDSSYVGNTAAGLLNGVGVPGTPVLSSLGHLEATQSPAHHLKKGIIEGSVMGRNLGALSATQARQGWAMGLDEDEESYFREEEEAEHAGAESDRNPFADTSEMGKSGEDSAAEASSAITVPSVRPENSDPLRYPVVEFIKASSTLDMVHKTEDLNLDGRPHVPQSAEDGAGWLPPTKRPKV